MNILHCKVKGTRPFFYHAAGPWIIPLEKEERTGVAGNNPEEWKKTVLADKEYNLYIRSEYVFSCIRNGGKSVAKGLQGKIASTLQVSPEKIYLDRKLPDGLKSLPSDPDDPVYLDVRVVKRDRKASNIRYRVACKTGWECKFDISFDGTLVSTNLMKAALREGGLYQGLGDGRSIGMGRFEVVEISENNK